MASGTVGTTSSVPRTLLSLGLLFSRPQISPRLADLIRSADFLEHPGRLAAPRKYSQHEQYDDGYQDEADHVPPSVEYLYYKEVHSPQIPSRTTSQSVR